MRLLRFMAILYHTPVLYTFVEVSVRGPEPSSKVRCTLPSTNSMDKKSLCKKNNNVWLMCKAQTITCQTGAIWRLRYKYKLLQGTYSAVGSQIKQQAVRWKSFEEHNDACGCGTQRLHYHRISTAVKVKRGLLCLRPNITIHHNHSYRLVDIKRAQAVLLSPLNVHNLYNIDIYNQVIILRYLIKQPPQLPSLSA